MSPAPPSPDSSVPGHSWPGLSPGALFAGDYELLRPLGEGGMGVVWLARERSLEREVALKIMRPSESATRLLRFAREARALAALDHPSILPVLHTGTDETTGATTQYSFEYDKDGNLSKVTSNTDGAIEMTTLEWTMVADASPDAAAQNKLKMFV